MQTTMKAVHTGARYYTTLYVDCKIGMADRPISFGRDGTTLSSATNRS